MNTKPVTGGKAFAVGNFGKTQKNVGRQVQQAKRQVQQAKRSVTRQFPGAERELWLPNAQRPSWLDGSLPGDRGFDPLGLAKPVDYIQFGQDKEVAATQGGLWEKGEVTGSYSAPQRYVASSPIAPWNDAFGLDRFRENEIINGRWAMLACLGIIVGETVTGVPWNEAGYVELQQPTYFGQKLPFTISQTVVVEVIGVGLAETFRSQAQNVDDRIYPGGFFDPLKLTEQGQEREYELRESEVKHCRLAMTAFAGLSLQALWRGTGAFASIAQSAADAGSEAPPLPGV